MSRKTYPAALNEVLAPMGFKREGMMFSRPHGDLIEQVDLQVSQIAGVTANLWTLNPATEALHRQAVPGRPPLYWRMFMVRIGELIDGHDRWWRRDPNGPAELAQAVQIHAPAFFDARRSLEAQAFEYGRSAPSWKNPFTRIYLALTLYQMDELDEACAALTNPAKALSPADQAEVDGVRRWLGCPGIDAGPVAPGA